MGIMMEINGVLRKRRCMFFMLRCRNKKKMQIEEEHFRKCTNNSYKVPKTQEHLKLIENRM